MVSLFVKDIRRLYSFKAILIPRVLSDVPKARVKIFHVWLLTLSIVFSSIGFKAVYDSHNRAKPPEKNLFSLHSWIGLAVIILLYLQWLCSFCCCFCRRLDENIRRKLISM